MNGKVTNTIVGMFVFFLGTTWNAQLNARQELDNIPFTILIVMIGIMITAVSHTNLQ